MYVCGSQEVHSLSLRQRFPRKDTSKIVLPRLFRHLSRFALISSRFVCDRPRLPQLDIPTRKFWMTLKGLRNTSRLSLLYPVNKILKKYTKTEDKIGVSAILRLLLQRETMTTLHLPSSWRVFVLRN